MALRLLHLKTVMAASVALLAVQSVVAQSKSVDSPTSVAGSEISGKIPAREVGDARLTTHYWALIANPGDISLEISVSNFTGDIDVFTADELRQKTKVTIFPGMDKWETSRLIYSRQREKLLIRIEGRSPNDDPAVYRIKLAGPYEPLPISERRSVEEPVVKKTESGASSVNSVGTIIAEPSRTEKRAGKKGETDTSGSAESEKKVAKEEPKPAGNKTEGKASRESSLKSKRKETAVSEPAPKRKENVKAKTETPVAKPSESKSRPDDSSASRKSEPASYGTLKITLRSGERLVLPMNRVSAVNIENGVLRLTTTDGKLRIVPMADVVKMGID